VQRTVAATEAANDGTGAQMDRTCRIRSARAVLCVARRTSSSERRLRTHWSTRPGDRVRGIKKNNNGETKQE